MRNGAHHLKRAIKQVADRLEQADEQPGQQTNDRADAEADRDAAILTRISCCSSARSASWHQISSGDGTIAVEIGPVVARNCQTASSPNGGSQGSNSLRRWTLSPGDDAVSAPVISEITLTMTIRPEPASIFDRRRDRGGARGK